MSNAPPTRPVVTKLGENMGPPGKAGARPQVDNSNRAVLGELTANAKLDKQQSSRSTSPLKRPLNILDDDKGFSYIKRRRLSHTKALTRRITPLSPPPSRDQQHQQQQHHHHAEQDSQSEGDSGRESQNSNVTRASFSSLINYDPSSQQQLSQHQHQHQHQHPMSIRSAAEMLRLRLRIAIYKVRTNQINVPFSRLQLHVKSAQPPPSPDALPMAPPPLRRNNDRNTHAAEQQQAPQPALFSTPNIFSNRFMHFTAPSSSPPLAHDPLPRIAREAQARMAAAAADRDSLDSEATELADDHDDNPVAESPLDRNRRHIMLPPGT